MIAWRASLGVGQRLGLSLRAWPVPASTRLSAAASSALALSAAARPSAIFLARSSSAFVDRRPDEFHREPDQDQEHDHLNDQGSVDAHVFILLPNDEAMREAWVRTRRLDYFDRLAIWAQERVGEGEHHRDTDADQERRVDQTGQQEHLGLQRVHQFGLTGGSFDVLAAHDADTDTGADSAQTDDQTGSQCDEAKLVMMTP